MLGIELDDVLNVLSSVQTQLIVIAVALVAAIVLTIVFGKKRVPDKGRRTLIRSCTWAAMVLVLAGSITSMLTGPLNSVVTLATGGRHELTQESIDTTNELAVDIEREGITLLQNDDGLLPIAAGNVNVFGWASSNPIYGGTGSGSLSDDYDTVSLLDGLSMAGFTTNTELTDFYTAYASERGTIAIMGADWTLPEPPASTYTDEMISNAKDFSDTAIVVIGRVGGEGLDLPTDMGNLITASTSATSTYTNNSDEYDDFVSGQHYLELSQTERDLLDLVTENFDDVILVYNGANTFEFDFLADYPQIKSVLWAPHPGQAGFQALGEVLTGEVNPSGKTSDTFIADFTQAPTWNNFGDFAYDNVEEFEVETSRGTRYPHFVNYTEGIYVGYRFYETAAAEGAIDYDSTVIYPFGYGLSYTTFEQEMGEVSYVDGTVSFDVTVTNTGDVAGKDVVEVYYNPPYTNGGIEKSTVNLVTYEKTKLLEPGESQTISISFEDDAMASYDYQDAEAYVLEAGDYAISIRTDSHTIVAEQTVNVPETITYNTEDNTHNGDETVATNVFDDANGGLTYLSRADGFANMEEALAAPTDYSMSDEAKAVFHNASNYDETELDDDSDEMPTTGADNGIMLEDLRGVDYDDEQWDLLLDELTFDEMDNIIANAGYQNAAIDSIGKVRLADVDGPAALRDNFTDVSSIGLPANTVLACTWNKELAYSYGQAIAAMAHDMEVSGWYAPSVNIHRSAFGGRTFEYFSEDPVLTGTLAAQQVLGAADDGVYAFVKHFALNEQETNRNGHLCTWANEQAIREIYLRPFEEVIKTDGDAQAVMGSFNYIGATWSSEHTGLNETVLRGEWGFKGFLETDYFGGIPSYGYMDADYAIRGGTDAMLATTSTSNHVTDESASSVIAMRRATKNILYTAVNSWRYENGTPETPIYGYQIAMYIMDAAAAVIAIFLVARGIIKMRRA